MENRVDSVRSVVVGVCIGGIVSFINSYGYAVSGYTTAEASLIIIPILTLLIYRLLRIEYTNEEFLVSIATALGVDITTTLASGMYITFGFLSHSIERLRAFGLEVFVPHELFSGDRLIDLYALPTYLSLSILSISGALIAYTFRSYFIEKERLRYPFATAAAILLNTFRRLSHGFREYLIAFTLGFTIQLYLLFSPLVCDLTPLLSSIAPGSALLLTFSPLVFGLFLLVPLAPLRMLSLSSLSAYLLIVPATVSILALPVLPAMSYGEALFAVAPVVVSLNLGVVAILLIYYLLRFRSLIASATSITLKLSIERAMFIMGLILLSLLGYTAFLLGRRSPVHLLMLTIPIAVLLHIILIVANMRVVGEVGMGSQTLFPVVTFAMYFLGMRETGVYAAIDPYTGIPMPQVVGGTAMNLFRFSRFFKGNAVRILKSFCIGVLLGSLITYIYGNILISVYGFDSPQMPLTRWIPTIVWMATIYSGQLGSASLYAVAVGLVIGALIVFLNWRIGLPIFSAAVGLTLPPDIGFTALLSYLVKSIMIKLGAALHERIVMLDMMFVIGAGAAIAVHILLTIAGVAM